MVLPMKLSQGLTIPISLTSLSRAGFKGLTGSCEILLVIREKKKGFLSFIGMSPLLEGSFSENTLWQLFV